MDHLGYGYETIHGAGRYVVDVLPVLVAAGLDVTLCILGDVNAVFQGLRSSGVHCLALQKGANDPRALWSLSRAMRLEQPDVVWAAQLRSSLLSRFIAHRMRVPWVVQIHDFVPVPSWMRTAFKLVPGSPGRAICVSKPVWKTMPSQYVVTQDNAFVLHNPVITGRINQAVESDRASARAELDIAANAPTGLIVGRLHPVKGHERLIRMLPEILRQLPDFVLIVLGEGPETERCMKLARDLGVSDQVRWLGFRDDVWRWYAAADILLVTSQSEGFCYVALEGAAAGLPVVAFDVGGIRDAVAFGKSGIGVPAFDDEVFVTAVVDVLTDAQLHASLSQCAITHAARFNIDTHVKKLSEILTGSLSHAGFRKNTAPNV